jgi:hypothetical protein
MNASEITVRQQKILSAVTVRCGSISLVPVLCDLLHLSKSAVYDRINGTQSLSFPELIVLLDTFSISLEEMMAAKPERVSFLTNSILTPVKNGQTYLKTLQENVTAFAQTDGLRGWFSSPSLPFFHHMHFRESKKQPETAQCGKLDLYYNEISPATISLLLESPSAKGVFTVLDDPDFMYSDNPYLYEYTLAWMHKLRVKCVRISEDAEREWRIYFNRIREQIKGGR